LTEWCCCIGIKFQMRAECEKVLENLAQKDPTFKYTIYNSHFPQYDQVIIVSAESRDQAHKRGLLLCGKDVPGQEKKCYFPKEYGLCYWVKETTMVNTLVKS